jgi:hypothetical protein
MSRAFSQKPADSVDALSLDKPVIGTIMTEKEPVKEKDVGQIVRYLSSAFNQATARMERPFRSKNGGANRLYLMQTEFAYRLNEVVQGPRCMMQKHIADCNAFIDQTIQDLAAEQTETSYQN